MALQDPKVSHSDSEDEDPDYVPTAAHEEASDDESERRSTKRRRTSSPPITAPDDVVSKETRDALWADFQSSVNTPPALKVEVPLRKKVKVEKRYRFAGEEVREVVEVDEDSEDAKKWPLWLPESAQYATTPTLMTPDAAKSTATKPLENMPGPSNIGHSDAAQSSATPPPKRAPSRKKSRLSLASLPDPSKGTPKAKKLSTLDKSAMDWQAHVATEGGDVKDALDANRRGGGYLEKVDFLQRVSDRKEDAFDASKGSKRRR